MRAILHLIDTTGPGGAETVYVELADRTRKHGYISIPVVHGPGWVADELARRGLKPILLPAQGRFNWRFLCALVALIRRHNISVIQAHLLGAGVYGALAGRITGVPVIATFHGMVDVNNTDRLKWLRRAIMNRGVNRYVCVSQGLKQQLAKSGFIDGARCDVIYNGIDLARYRKPPAGGLCRRLLLPEDTPLIGCLGNLRPAKGYQVLIRAAAVLKRAGVRGHVVIAGQGKGRLADDLAVLCTRLNVTDRVHFIGYEDDSAAFLAELDIFALPSLSEGFSISTIEAMATGLPIVVTRCGGPEEIITAGVTGLMVTRGSSRALAMGLRQLLEDRETAQTLAANAQREAQQRFGVGKMITQYRALYGQFGLAPTTSAMNR